MSSASCMRLLPLDVLQAAAAAERRRDDQLEKLRQKISQVVPVDDRLEADLSSMIEADKRKGQ